MLTVGEKNFHMHVTTAKKRGKAAGCFNCDSDNKR